MRIKGGTVEATVSSYATGKHNNNNDRSFRHVQVLIGRTKAQCKEMFGEALTEAIFGAHVERPVPNEEGHVETVWVVKKQKPWGKTVTCEHHKITVGDTTISPTQPVILFFEAIDEHTEKVNAMVAFAVGFAETKQRRYLDDHHGKQIRIKFEAVKVDLPLEKRAAQDKQLEIIKGGGAQSGVA